MTSIQYAWMIYGAGSLGCCIATWWLFLRAWRFVRYSAVATVMVILFTPFAIDPQAMAMAPAIFTLAFNGLSLGLDSIKPIIKLMVGIWLIAIVILSVFVILTRGAAKPPTYEPFNNNDGFVDQNFSAREPSLGRSGTSQRVQRARPNSRNNNASIQKERFESQGLSSEEHTARSELLAGEVPMRAIRD